MTKSKIASIILLLFCYSFILFAQENGTAGAFVLSGKVIGRDTGKLILDYTDSKGDWNSDTTTLRRGEFLFKGTVEGPERASLTGDVKSRSVDDPNFTEVFLEAGKMTLAVSENAFLECCDCRFGHADGYEFPQTAKTIKHKGGIYNRVRD